MPADPAINKSVTKSRNDIRQSSPNISPDSIISFVMARGYGDTRRRVETSMASYNGYLAIKAAVINPNIQNCCLQFPIP